MLTSPIKSKFLPVIIHNVQIPHKNTAIYLNIKKDYGDIHKGMDIDHVRTLTQRMKSIATTKISSDQTTFLQILAPCPN